MLSMRPSLEAVNSGDTPVSAFALALLAPAVSARLSPAPGLSGPISCRWGETLCLPLPTAPDHLSPSWPHPGSSALGAVSCETREFLLEGQASDDAWEGLQALRGRLEHPPHPQCSDP